MFVDKSLFFITSILVTIGIVFSLSLPVFDILRYDYSHFHFFIRQLIIGCFGIFLMWFLSRLNPEKYVSSLCFFTLIVCVIIMLAMPLMPSNLVYKVNGASRWIKLPGFSFSPVEFFKVGFIYFLAWSFSRRIGHGNKNIKQELSILFPYFIVFSFVIYLIAFLQNDLGQIFVLGSVLIMMVLLAGTSFKIILIGFLVFASSIFLIIITSANRIKRVQSWWSGVQDIILKFFPQSFAQTLKVENIDAPYQVGHSLNAINSGGFFGQGLGEGMFKLGFLSEVHTDFVLSGIIEEIGILGLGIIIILFYILLFRIFKIGSRSKSQVYYLFCSGIGFMIFFSFLINAFGITSITPVKGLAVPFISYGGSHLLASCFTIGIVLMISKKSNFRG